MVEIRTSQAKLWIKCVNQIRSQTPVLSHHHFVIPKAINLDSERLSSNGNDLQKKFQNVREAPKQKNRQDIKIRVFCP